ncbi:BLOC-3 complex member HPS4 isoform X1 [Pelobates fuscus]|uniref:BLOC-3 complex member HPS4 isoform X1 n=1 Tax=Pelobates fuscus TaxID=191477 RepID=UPI002FE4F7D3
MASADCVELKPSSWLSYYFLYDGSKVKGEGDLTRVGIKYFHPPQTNIDQQELLCGQVAGVVRCMKETIGSLPTLIRLRKLKFAIMVHGDFLWGLGCSMDVTDVSCKKYLEDMIGLFRFYNGPLWRAYKIHPHHELNDDWRIYLEHIENTTDLNRIFNSLSHVDKTKIDPLLLLKATLILQTCQRFPHVLAGCILYDNRIVSTQLPPQLTSKILVDRIYAYRRPPSVFSNHSDDPVLPEGVRLLEVFIKEQDAIALCHYPAQWLARIPSNGSESISSVSQIIVEEANTHQLVSEDLALEKESANLDAPFTKMPESSEAAVLLAPHEDLENAGIVTETLSVPSAETPVRSSSPLKNLYNYELSAEDDQHTITEGSPQSVYLGDSTDLLVRISEGPPITEFDFEVRSNHQSTGSFVTCGSTTEIDKISFDDSGSSNMEDSQDSFYRSVAVFPEFSTSIPFEQKKYHHHFTLIRSVENIDALADGAEGDLESHANNTGNSEVISSDSAHLNMSTKASTDTDWTLTLDSSPSASSSKFVKILLYVHNVKGLVLSLMAEMPFRYEHGLIQDVYDGTLAALNGLEVHLKETMPTNNHNVTKATYSFTHYDSIQNIITANLPSVSSTLDRHLLRGASLIHSDFSLQQSLKEITIRNASSALYACQSTVHQTYFQQVAPPFRNSGFPDPQDSAFLLPSKAKQKLLKHGFNLL